MVSLLLSFCPQNKILCVTKSYSFHLTRTNKYLTSSMSWTPIYDIICGSDRTRYVGKMIRALPRQSMMAALLLYTPSSSLRSTVLDTCRLLHYTVVHIKKKIWAPPVNVLCKHSNISVLCMFEKKPYFLWIFCFFFWGGVATSLNWTFWGNIS